MESSGGALHAGAHGLAEPSVTHFDLVLLLLGEGRALYASGYCVGALRLTLPRRPVLLPPSMGGCF